MVTDHLISCGIDGYSLPLVYIHLQSVWVCFCLWVGGGLFLFGGGRGLFLFGEKGRGEGVCFCLGGGGRGAVSIVP